jgi:hypothetical protein
MHKKSSGNARRERSDVINKVNITKSDVIRCRTCKMGQKLLRFVNKAAKQREIVQGKQAQK